MLNYEIIKIYPVNVVQVYIDHMNVDMLEVQEENHYQQVLYNDYHNIHYVIDRLNNKNFYHNMKHLFNINVHIILLFLPIQ